MTAVDEDAADVALIARAAAGDERAFAELMTRHQPRLYAVCHRITGHREDALDALQEALTRAWRSAARFRGDAQVSTWLYRIAVNAALAEVDRRARRPHPVDRVPDGWLPAEDEAVVGRMAVDDALRRLPPDHRAAVVLRDVCGCTYAEIADVLGTPLNTVKTRISRGRQALLRLLPPAAGREGPR